MKKHRQSQTVRRSVALPRRLVEDVEMLAPDQAKNWNRLVVSALEEYAARHRRTRFEESMEAMAADPAIRAGSKKINERFKKTDRDGL
jgi:hypothetical protein